MPGKCANPHCPSVFSFFRKTRLYVVEARPGPKQNAWPTAQVQYYWLCSTCAETLELLVDEAGTALVVPRGVPSKATAA